MPRAKGVTSTPRGDLQAAVGYIRVSTDEQHLGPEAQRQGIARWCVKHRIKLAGCYVDQGVSGSSLPSDRSGFNEALAQLQETRAGWLVVLVRDRLAREAHYAGHAETVVERLGARIITTEETPGSEDSLEAGMIRTVRDMAARAEKASIRRRITQALAVKSARGERVGSVPFGWVADRGPRVSKADAPARLVPHDKEQETILVILSLRKQGKNYTQIARSLTQMGHQCRGKDWHHTTIARIVQRAATTTDRSPQIEGSGTTETAPARPDEPPTVPRQSKQQSSAPNEAEAARATQTAPKVP